MAFIEEDLRTFLVADPAITALVVGRIYPLKLPQDPTLPAIAYMRVSGFRGRVQDGPAGYARPTFQIDCWADSYLEAKNVADAVRQRLQAYKGTMGTTEVQSVRFLGDRDDFERDVENFRILMDFEIWHLET